MKAQPTRPRVSRQWMELAAQPDAVFGRGQENIVFQRQMVATLDRGGHDVKAARMFLRRLEAKKAKHIADWDRLLKLLANSF
jgi:hypothetical protein